MILNSFRKENSEFIEKNDLRTASLLLEALGRCFRASLSILIFLLLKGSAIIPNTFIFPISGDDS